jgi:anthranilate synthase/aminodeoxychorismate synthase-like glutamine amidotransferase
MVATPGSPPHSIAPRSITMKPRILVVDCYDSFTYNLVQALAVLGAECEVVLCDAIDPAGVRERAPDGVLLSPGPCTPDEAGATLAILRELGGDVPMLGVCLGHQAIAQAFGARVVRAALPKHGKTSRVEHDGRTIFESVRQPFTAARYNSLVVAPDTLPSCLHVSAWTEDGEVMALRHRMRPLEGVQFHPESILSEEGDKILANWLRSLLPAH